MPQRVGYLDEAYDERVYILACVNLDGGDSEVRQVLRDMLMPGQRQLHFTKEGKKRRLLLAETVGSLQLPITVVVRPSPEPVERRRGQCLVALVWAAVGQLDEFVFEARQRRLNERDASILRGIATHGPDMPARFVPAEAAEELWLADIVAGAIFADLARGVRTYRAALGPLTVIET